MVHTPVQEGPVVGYQNKTLFPVEIPADDFPSPDIQMVGGFVNQQEIVFFQEQHRQLQFGLFAVGQGIVGPVKGFFLQLQ